MMAVEEAVATVNPPPELAGLKQWVCWKYGKSRPNRKREKVPINPRTGRKAKTDDPKTWDTFEAAVAAVEERGYEGVGFVFTPEDPFAGIDMDGCRNPKTGEIEPWALRVVKFLGSYAEVSPSGTGIKAFVQGGIPVPGRRKGQVEMYNSGRFFAFTGQRIWGERVEKRQPQLDALYQELFPPELEHRAPDARAGQGFVGEDEKLLMMLRRAADGQKFADVFDGGSLAYHRDNHKRHAYPPVFSR